MQLRAVLIRLMAQKALRRLKSQPLDPNAYLLHPTAEMRVENDALLPLRGGINFRDLGGYRTLDGYMVRYGKVYRSGDLSGLTDADRDYLLNTLGIKFICDLRNPEEGEGSPHRFPDGKITYLSLPIMRNTSSSEERLVGRALLSGDRMKIDEAFGRTYLTMVDEAALSFGQALKVLTDSANLPAIVHCTAGKDRTGITTALLLSALGVPDSAIIADYSLTNLAYKGVYLTAKNNRSYRATGIPTDLLTPVLVAKPRWIEQVLTHVQQTYGSVDRYLTTVGGLTPADMEALKTNLLE